VHTYAESSSTVADRLLHTPGAQVEQIVSNGESEPEAHNDEWIGISVQESTVYFYAESDVNSGWEISHEAGRSEEICSSHQSDATSTTETGTEEEEISSGQLSEASTTEERGRMSAEVVTSCQPFAASTASVGGPASPSTSPAAVLPAPDVSCSSSDGDSQKCPICLDTFRAQEVGTPDTCDHFFCTGCLLAWSANANTCPLDRKEFNVILVRHNPEGEVIRRIPVRQNPVQIEIEDFFLQDLICCALCFRNDRENTMFCCYGCCFSYHQECVSAFLDTMALDGWFCPICHYVRFASEAQ
jgi:hypothetical protein